MAWVCEAGPPAAPPSGRCGHWRGEAAGRPEGAGCPPGSVASGKQWLLGVLCGPARVSPFLELECCTASGWLIF